MPVKVWICIGGLLLYAATVAASMEVPARVLRIYGPGGPHHVLAECAELFGERHGVDVTVIKALPYELDQKVREDGDIYYGGAECMLEEFDGRNPGVLDMSTVEKLHPRRIGIVVRKGNPLNIEGVEDLDAEGIEILDVKLENMRQLHNASGLSSNLRRYAYTGQQGTVAWLSTPTIDAWVTYKTWYVRLVAESDFIEIPGDAGLRFTPMALTHRTPHRQEAMQFIDFLKSREAHQIFVQHGWE
jgi:accessory colonization factor AcfC